MEALRLIADPINHQLVINLPPSMASRRLEVIVFPANEHDTPPEVVMRHTPSPKLAGTVILHDDLIAPACQEEDWDALR
jgi:hypothetical protein